MKKRALMRAALVTALVGASIVPSPPAAALFHLIKITEVFGGASQAPDAHFVEMQMYSENQRFLASHEVVVYDSTGTEAGRFTFTAPVENGASQAYVLLATTEAQDLFGVPADLVIEPVIDEGGGKVCFVSNQGEPVDCASWGDYSGDNEGSSTPFNAPVGLVVDRSMERDTTGGDDPEALDEGDDTDDSAADFELAEPTPTNNAGAASATEDHDRSVTLRLRENDKLVASGEVASDHAPCAEEVDVKLQRRASGRWSSVKTSTTDAGGAYRMAVRKRTGRYRVKAPASVPAEGHRCLVAVSPTRRAS